MLIKQINIIKKTALGILGFIGIIAVLVLTGSHNAGIAPDSVAYIAVARSLAEGGGFVTFDGFYYVLQPPLYSMLLASIKIVLSIDPIVSAGYLNALLFGLIVYISGLFLLKYLKSFTMVLLGTLSILISSALVQTSLMALSEPLFIFLVLMFLFYFEKYQSKQSLIYLVLFSVSAALACLTRYTGIIIILTGIIFVMLWVGNNLKKKLIHSLFFSIVSAVPISIWIMRNYFLSGTLVGRRAASSYTLFDNLKFFYDTIVPWFLPMNSVTIYVVLFFLIATLWILSRLYPAKSSYSEDIKVIGPSLLFVLFYLSTLIISSTTTAYDQISDRLLSPIYIPTIFILFFSVDKIISWLTNYFRLKLIPILFFFCIIIILRYPLKNTLHFIDEYKGLSGWGYNCDSWRESETINFLNSHEQLGENYKLYSNEPEAVYILTNLKTKRSPAKTFYNSPKLFINLGDKKDTWQNGEDVCIIWFDNANRSFLFTIEELQKKINMKEVAHLKDGGIYTFRVNDFGVNLFSNDNK